MHREKGEGGEAHTEREGGAHTHRGREERHTHTQRERGGGRHTHTHREGGERHTHRERGGDAHTHTERERERGGEAHTHRERGGLEKERGREGESTDIHSQ